MKPKLQGFKSLDAWLDSIKWTFGMKRKYSECEGDDMLIVTVTFWM